MHTEPTLALARKILMALRRRSKNEWDRSVLLTVVYMLHPKLNPKMRDG